MDKATALLETRNRIVSRTQSLLNQTLGHERLILEIIQMIQSELQIEAVGIRFSEGPDFPYFFTSGFSRAFIRREKFLSARKPNGTLVTGGTGTPLLECMCGNVIQGRTDPQNPFFTPYGSFWTNSTTELLASTKPEDLPTRSRNQCLREGFESIALIPIRSEGTTWGLLQLNDRRPERHDLDTIEVLEKIGISLGLLFTLKRKDEELAAERRELERLSSTLPNEHQIPSGVISICSVCKDVRNEDGTWQRIESYLTNRSSLRFTHGFCQSCKDSMLAKL